ncbi:MAG: Vitamin K-dependent gamma-carboxylase, partial [Segetibacter sp.]|nr:Vitamin K-dependent gamma-carboxylase [Segetibacter sp.]
MKQYFSSLWQPVNNSPLIVFRILFGFIMTAECIEAIYNGFVKQLYIDIQYNFTFIGFEWLNVLHGRGMYIYFILMAIAALFVAIGFLYRYSSILLALMWTAFYLSEKTHYNNHYYLMVLLCWLMAFMPANRRFSADVKLKLATPHQDCYRWQIHLFIFQVSCMYFFAALAKINSDWLHAMPLKIWLTQKTRLPVIGWAMRNRMLPWCIAYGGLLFDLLIIPGLLFARTRKYFFVLAVIFHLFNSYVFRIGYFPFLALSLTVFFFPASLFQKIIQTPSNPQALPQVIKGRKMVSYAICAYVIVQLLLPIRHWFIQGPVDWTEEGYRMSWHMMLRSKRGTGYFKIVDKQNDSTWKMPFSSFLHPSQVISTVIHPDITWQAAQYLKEKYNKQKTE